MADRDYKAELQKLADALRNPLRLRWAVCLVALVVAYFAIYGPLSESIARSTRKLKDAENRATTSRDTEFLKAQVEMFESRLSANPDPNETTQYVLDGIRALPIKLIRLDSHGTVTVGPFEALVLQVEVSGEIEQLDKLLAWFETNERLFRIDSLRLEPPRGQVTEPAYQLKLLSLKVK